MRGMFGNPREDVCQPGLGVDAIHFGRGDEAIHGRDAPPSAIRTAEQPGFSAEGYLRGGVSVVFVWLPTGTLGPGSSSPSAHGFYGAGAPVGGGCRHLQALRTIDRGHLRRVLDQRVTDGVVRRMIDKWLKVGVLERGALRRATDGTPQGDVISPLLSNIYLRYAQDEWFETVARPRLEGRCQLVRCADDAVTAFEDLLSGQRMLALLGKRLERFGLTLHPIKTRFVDFRFRRPKGRHPATSGTTFDFLGFTHVWGKSRKGKDVVRQITAKDRYARALAAVSEWRRRTRHRPFRERHVHLSRMIRGHCAYYGISGNSRRLRWYDHQVVRIWRKWLARRGRHSKLSWSRFAAWLARHPLPPLLLVHVYSAS